MFDVTGNNPERDGFGAGKEAFQLLKKLCGKAVGLVVLGSRECSGAALLGRNAICSDSCRLMEEECQTIKSLEDPTEGAVGFVGVDFKER